MKRFLLFANCMLCAVMANAQNSEITEITDLGPAGDKIEIYAGPDLYTGNWSNYPKAAFSEKVESGFVINVHLTGDADTSGQCLQSLYKTDEGTVDHLCIGNNEWRCQGVPAGESVVSYTVASPEEAEGINAFGGWVFGGDKVTINSIWIAGPGEGPVTLSGWSGHKYKLPTVAVGDVITHNVTGLGGGMMKSFAKKADGTSIVLVGNDTGWNGINVAEGDHVVSYTVANQDEADAINIGYYLSGEKVTVTKMTHIPADLVKVHSVEVANSSVIYDLSGKRTQNIQKGIYIINGQKYVK